jgi:hypothetical protein
MKKLLFEASAPVDAPADRVRSLIAGDWVVEQMGATEYVDVDHHDGVVGFQGHWWYRGEVSVDNTDGRTTITYRVFNIAQRAAWAVPLANKMFVGYGASVRESANGLARSIERELAAG